MTEDRIKDVIYKLTYERKIPHSFLTYPHHVKTIIDKLNEVSVNDRK